MEWAKIEELGAGAFEQVLCAVYKEAFFTLLKREAEAIGRIEHPFVVDCLCSEANINAPEISSGAQGQTPKADIWSLFMVLIWTHDFKAFRRDAYAGHFTVSTLLQLAREAAAPGQQLAQLGEMARSDPEKRASAAQMMLNLGLFSQEPRAILCSHGKDPRRIPAMPADEPPPKPAGGFPPVPARRGGPGGERGAFQ
ncbi:hypothetical protein INS49_002587 [Diaporthe citri]|uniref:uncharacterized protein n=1 Tax=Diaporthe citri TaxID=83186 RepID=UPI001C7E76CF|nr:uncharacterized protein INS49_002587 [Diaporthe citri]KAG6368381.1 hypothetical protein INS49_002587 [Diaporthe citri]